MIFWMEKKMMVSLDSTSFNQWKEGVFMENNMWFYVVNMGFMWL
jgi:hypothetical protein